MGDERCPVVPPEPRRGSPEAVIALAAVLVAAYLVGAFPSSVVLGRLVRGVDVRKHGSGNAGATNAWRVLGWRIGLSVLVLDAAKGALAASVFPRLAGGSLPLSLPIAAILCGLAAVVGHVFPIYLRFRGGKGVATAAGMLLAVAPLPVATAVLAFLITLTATGWVSLGSLVGAWTMPVLVAALPPSTDATSHALLLALTGGLAAFLTFTHRSNLRRLVRGEEKSFPALQIWRRLQRTKRS